MLIAITFSLSVRVRYLFLPLLVFGTQADSRLGGSLRRRRGEKRGPGYVTPINVFILMTPVAYFFNMVKYLKVSEAELQGNCKLKGESNVLNKTKKRNGHFPT